MLGGASSMRSGEHKSQISLDSLKYYVVGKGRYKSFQLERSDDVDMRNVMPLGAYEAFESMKAYLESAGRWKSVRDALIGTRDEGSKNENAYQGFIEDVWAPAVRGSLESHTGLVGDMHMPQLTSGGTICYDVKVLKMLPRRSSFQDMDINGDITRTRAIEILRILRTKIAQWPAPLAEVMFRGHEDSDGNIQPIQTDTWPHNASDEPFSGFINSDFQYNADFVGPDGSGPTFQATEKPWGLLVAIIKPGSEDEFEQEFEVVSASRSVSGGAKAFKAHHKDHKSEYLKDLKDTKDLKDMYAFTKIGPTNKFGTRKELTELEWVTNGHAAVGLKDGFIEAWRWHSTMPKLLQSLNKSQNNVYHVYHVYIPAKTAGRADGYFATDEPDWASMIPWALEFSASCSVPRAAAAAAETAVAEKMARKMLGMKTSMPDVKSRGHRGGNYIEIQCM
jgi:hypothetical protein